MKHDLKALSPVLRALHNWYRYEGAVTHTKRQASLASAYAVYLDSGAGRYTRKKK